MPRHAPKTFSCELDYIVYLNKIYLYGLHVIMQATHATPLNFRFVSVLVLVSAFAFVSVFAVAASVSFYSFGKATLLIKKLETRN
jgi:hypothetical protein